MHRKGPGRTMRSDSPRYLEARVADDTLKKVHLVSVAAALASMVCRGVVWVGRGIDPGRVARVGLGGGVGQAR